MKRNALIILSACVTFIMYGQTWEQKGSYIYGDNALDHMGDAISLSKNGNIMAVGASWNDANGEDSGHVKVFEYNYDNQDWQQLGSNINGESSGDRFGGSVSLSADGSILAVGGWLNDVNGMMNAGHVKVFKYNTESNTWDQLGSNLEGESNSAYFGISLSLSSDGSTLAIGADHNEGVNGFLSGHVKIYKYNGNSNQWELLGNEIDGESSGDRSGGSVSLSDNGNIVAIGARLNDGSGITSGHTRVFQYDSNQNNWYQMGTDIDGEALGDNSGISVSLSNDGNKLAIGSTLNTNESGQAAGHVRVFEFNANNSTWNQMGSTINGESAFDRFGGFVSLSGDGNVLAASSRLSDTNGTDTGHVRVFEFNTNNNNWEQLDVDIDGDNAYDNFGVSISLSDDGKSIAIGSDQSTHPFSMTQTGYVKVYEFDEGVTLSLGEESLNEEGFKIYPNPTAENLKVSIPEVIIEKVSIYNLNGSLVLCNNINTSELSIPVQNLAVGNYIVKIETDKGEISKLFVKE